MKKVEFSKEKQVKPIVQMELLINQNKIPIGYQLFPSNAFYLKTLMPMIEKNLKTNSRLENVTILVDNNVIAHLILLAF